MVVCGGLWDHPRSRGVYGQAHRSITSLSGSSPLARGLLRLRGDLHDVGRIIPARAGFTECVVRAGPALTGSSPLARGLRFASGEPARKAGIIPARAGFTST